MPTTLYTCTITRQCHSIPHEGIDNVFDTELLEVCVRLSDTDKVDRQASDAGCRQRRPHFVVD